MRFYQIELREQFFANEANLKNESNRSWKGSLQVDRMFLFTLKGQKLSQTKSDYLLCQKNIKNTNQDCRKRGPLTYHETPDANISVPTSPNIRFGALICIHVISFEKQ
jgi:hypothetical protein